MRYTATAPPSRLLAYIAITCNTQGGNYKIMLYGLSTRGPGFLFRVEVVTGLVIRLPGGHAAKGWRNFVA